MLFHILELLVTSCANQGTRSCSRTPPASPTRFGWRTVFASGMHKVVSHLSVSCCQLSVWDVSVICQLLWTCQSFELVNSFGLVVVVTLGLSRCRHRSAGGPKPEPKQLFVWEVKRRSDEWQHQRVTKSNDLVCSWASGSGLLLCSCSALQGGVQPVDQTICSSRFMFDTWAFAGICQVVCWSAHNSAVKTWLDWLIPLQCKWTCFDIVFFICIIFLFKKVAFNRPCQPTSAVHVGMSAVFTDAVSCFIVSILPCMFQMFTVHSAKLSSLERFEGQCVLQTVFRSSQVRWHEYLRSWTMSSAQPYSVAALDSKNGFIYDMLCVWCLGCDKRLDSWPDMNWAPSHKRK